MFSEIWNNLKHLYSNKLSHRARIFIESFFHQTGHLIILVPVGIIQSLIGRGILKTFGWTPNELAFLDVVADVVGTMIIAPFWFYSLVIIYTIFKIDGLKYRKKWLLHATFSLIPISSVSFLISMLGSAVLGANTIGILHSGAANGIGTAISIPTTLFFIIALRQFGHFIKHCYSHQNENYNAQENQNVSFKKKILDNIFHEAINIGIVYISGIISTMSGLGLLAISKKINADFFLKALVADLVGISVVVIPLGIFYCSINTFIQKKDALIERNKWITHSALRLGPTTIGMPLLTTLGYLIVYGGDNISFIAASNGIGTLLLSFCACISMTCFNWVALCLTRNNSTNSAPIDTFFVQVNPPLTSSFPLTTYPPIIQTMPVPVAPRTLVPTLSPALTFAHVVITSDLSAHPFQTNRQGQENQATQHNYYSASLSPDFS